MDITTWKAAGRTYRVAAGLPSAESLNEALSGMTADAGDVDALVVVTPPRNDMDAAVGLHVFTPAGEPCPADGVDALCGFHGLRAATAGELAETEMRFGDRAVGLFALKRDPAMVEADLGKPLLNPTDARLVVDGLESIDPPHTFEIPLGDDQTAIATLLGLEGAHAVMFTDDLDGAELQAVGEALAAHGVSDGPVAVHAVQIGEPGWVRVRSWDRVRGAAGVSGFGLGAACAAGVTMCCTIASNAARLEHGRLEAAWDGDGHVRLRGRVDPAG